MEERLFFKQKAKDDFEVVIIDLSRPKWKQRLFNALKPPFVPVTPGGLYAGQRSFLELLRVAKEELGACTAVIEPYISTDWNSEYSAVYCRTFESIPQFAQRIHFFNKRLSLDKLNEMPDNLATTYLGYTVVRPLKAFRVGDTVLTSPWKAGPQSRHNLVHCLEKFDISLLGNSLTVSGMPFFQQDTTVGVCAEADLWMVARYLNKKGETRRLRPAEITQLATKTITVGPPRVGLIELQIVDALRQMGLNPVRFPGMAYKEAKEFIYSHVESELPVILGIIVRDQGHVVVVIGHDYENPIGSQTYSLSEVVGSFIVHDDSAGPYRKMKVDSTPIKVQNKTLEWLTLDGCKLDFFVVCYHPRVHMNLDDVKEATELWITRINDHVSGLMQIDKSKLWAKEQLRDLVFRTYLRLSKDFKHDILNPAAPVRRNEKIIIKYRCMQMPKYVWVVELARRSELENISPYNRKIRGEIVFNSTANRHVPGETLMTFHLDGKMFVPGRRGKLSELIVEQESPYSPLQRPIIEP